MPLAIDIGARQHVDFVQKCLQREMALLKAEGTPAKLEIATEGEMTVWGCQIANSSQQAAFRNYIASAIARAIIERWEDEILEKLIVQSYYYFTPKEREEVQRRARAILGRGEAGYAARPEGYHKRQSMISREVSDYLEANTRLNVEGFIRFRLQEYMVELESVMEEAVDGFLLDKEYDEFIRLLRYFVDVQEPKAQELHVILSPSGAFDLLDEEGRQVGREYVEGFVVELVEGEFSYEDLLVSALITMAPAKVVVHSSDQNCHQSTLATIAGVFEERYTLCRGCRRFNHQLRQCPE